MEDVVYPDINDYWQYLSPNGFTDTFFEDPSQSLYGAGQTSNSAHMYGAAVFCHFIDQHNRVKGRQAIRGTLERMAELHNGDVPVIFGVIEDRLGESMDDLLARFWAWSYFTGDRTRPGFSFEDAEGYTYPPPNALPNYQWVVEDLSTTGESVGLHTVSPLGGWITRIVPDGSVGGVTVTFSPQNDETENWSWHVVVVSGYTVKILEPDGDYVDIGGWDMYDDIVVVAGNGEMTGFSRSFTITTAYDKALTRPTPVDIELDLAQNQPNPFNVGTTIPFTLTTDANVTVRVYDVTGRLVRTLAEYAPFSVGDNSVVWDGLANNGRKTGSGVYLVRVVAGKAVRVRAMTLVR
jgi:flagellar hook capping protein FlgD